MKKIILIAVFILAALFQNYAQKPLAKILELKKIALSPEKWIFQPGKVDFVEYQGRRAMKIAPLSGLVVPKDLIFGEGTIEYDVMPSKTEGAASIYFHRKDEKEQEIVYLRVPKMTSPFDNEGIQYSPYLDGVNMWDMYPQYQAAAQANAEGWNHIKLIISGKQMQVFVNNKLRLEIPKLEGRESQGSIAFEGESYISNISLKPNETEGLSSLEAADLTRHEANYIRTWAITQPAALAPGTEPTTLADLPNDDSFTAQIEAERYGLVNFTRRFGASPHRKIVWLKAIITTKEAVKTNLQLGFSDEIWLYLNDQITYTDKNIYRQNMKKYPDGRISVQNGSTPIKLKQGENELLIGVANDFYGWGLIARLESTAGITAIAPYQVPQKIALENIHQYLGEYTPEDGTASRLNFIQKEGTLILQIPGQQDLPLNYIGQNLFKIGLGVELQFNPELKQVIRKENGFEMKFSKLN